MDQKQKSMKIIDKLIKQYHSARGFARMIHEDPSDVIRWRKGHTKVKSRAVVAIARYCGVKPWDLRPDIFPEDLKFNFYPKG